MEAKRFIKPGAFSNSYNTSSPTRQMEGGRRQTIALDTDSVPIEEVQKLLLQARNANNLETKTISKEKLKQLRSNTKLSSSKRKKLKSPSSSPPKHTFGGSDRFAPNAPAHIIRQPGQDQRGALSPAELILPDAPTLGNTLSSRAASQQHSHSSNTNTSTSTSPVRMSSNGTVLRRGSQVMTAPRQQVRQYRHPREMESALIDSEAKIALLEDKLDATTSVLRRTQSELLQRNADLEAANVKTNSLMLMVQELLQHVVEKREGRRFSETASIEIDKIMKQPIEHYSKHDDMQNYIDSKINAIDDLLPKWTSLPSDFMSDEVDEDSNFGDDYNTAPPPLPPQQSRR